MRPKPAPLKDTQSVAHRKQAAAEALTGARDNPKRDHHKPSATGSKTHCTIQEEEKAEEENHTDRYN